MKDMLDCILFLIFRKHVSADFSIRKGLEGIEWHFELSLNR